MERQDKGERIKWHNPNCDFLGQQLSSGLGELDNC